MPSLRRTCILVFLASAAARAPPPSTAPLPSHPHLPSPSALSAWRRSLRSSRNTSTSPTTGTASFGRALEWAPGAGTTSDRQTCGGCCFSVLTDMSSLRLDSFYKKRSVRHALSSIVRRDAATTLDPHSPSSPAPHFTSHPLVLLTHSARPPCPTPLALLTRPPHSPSSLALLTRPPYFTRLAT